MSPSRLLPSEAPPVEGRGGDEEDEGVLTVFFWQDEPDHEDASWCWDDDWEGPTEEP